VRIRRTAIRNPQIHHEWRFVMRVSDLLLTWLAVLGTAATHSAGARVRSAAMSSEEDTWGWG
jgi:hypothetical protein